MIFCRDFVEEITSKDWAEKKRDLIDDWRTFVSPGHYGADFYSPEDQGTSHISVVSPAGDAVAVTTSLNWFFGAEVLSERTGILLNDQMDDFSYPDIINVFGVPPSPSNMVRPGKRPMSSMCPTVIIDQDSQDVRLVVGGAGGTKITTAVAQTIIYNLLLGWDLQDSLGQNAIKSSNTGRL